MAKFAKGNPGRPVGAKNKAPMALKDMILQALANAGGADYLVEQSRKNPSAFMSLVGRVLPVQTKEDSTEPRVPAPVIHEHIA